MQLSVSESSIVGWEADKKVPLAHTWPRVIKFLGYDPYREPKSLFERLLAARRHLRICHRSAAKMLSVDEWM